LLLRSGYDRVWAHSHRKALCISAQRALARTVRTCSIIVPVFNEQRTFPELMRRLLHKRLDHLGLEREIILIEGNSTDGTRELVAGFAATPGVKILWEDRPLGKGHAVRAGLRVAAGDIVLIQDADLEYDLNDYDALLERRIMHNLSADEVRQLAADGVDVQLHTHRHRTPRDRHLFLREIEDNRASIQAMTGHKASHFCYPSGVYDPMFLPWLTEAGVVSATTCEAGFAARSSNPLLLPRFLDSESLSEIEFESWLTGMSLAIPRRRAGTSAQAGGVA